MIKESVFKHWLYSAGNYIGGHKGFTDNNVLCLSGTDFCKGPREVFLTLAHKDELEKPTLDQVFKARIGTILHGSFEDFFTENYPNAVCEERREKTLELDGIEVKLTGQVDMIHEGRLYDLKTRSTMSYGKNDKFKLQGSIYKHILFPDLVKDNDMTIVSLWTDWKRGTEEPNSPVTTESVELLSKEETLAFLENWVHKFTKTTDICSPEDRWEKETTWAVQKPNAKRALRTFKSKAEADGYVKPGSGQVVVERPGVSIKCESYCPVKEFCNKTSKESACGSEKPAVEFDL